MTGNLLPNLVSPSGSWRRDLPCAAKLRARKDLKTAFWRRDRSHQVSQVSPLMTQDPLHRTGLDVHRGGNMDRFTRAFPQ